MRLIRSMDTILRQYVLGELRERPRLEIEERLITDPEIFDALGTTEDELAEEYLEDTLNAAEKRGFEQHFLTGQDRRRQLDFIRLLKSHASAAAPSPARDRDIRDWRPIVHGFRFHPAWTGAVAALLVMLVGGNLWFATWSYRLQGQLERVRVQQGLEAESRQKLQRQVESLTAQASTLTTRLESQLVPGQSPPTFSLEAGQLRGAAPFRQITIPSGAQVVRLRLDIPGAEHPTYRAALYDDQGDEIWAQSKLRAEAGPGGPAVAVALPTQVLARGDYRIKLSGASARGQLEVIATYSFRVNIP